MPIEIRRIVAEAVIWYIIWRVLDLLFEYTYSWLRSLPSPSFQLIPSSVSFSSIISLVFAIVIVFSIFVMLEKRRNKRPKQRVVVADILEKGKKEELACVANLIEQIQAFINEPPQERFFAGSPHIDQQWVRGKAVNLNQLAATAKGLIGSEFNMGDFIANPDLLAQTAIDWRADPTILLQMDSAWGHLVRLAQKLQGEIEVYKRQRTKAPLTQEQLRQELKRAAKETRIQKEKEVRNEKHIGAIYEGIDSLGKFSDFLLVNATQDFLAYPDPDSFPEEISSHLEAYNALAIATSAKELCKNFNTDLEKAIGDTIREFIELVEKRAEGEKFSLQRYDIIPHPDHYYSPDILAWNIYHNAGAFQPYKIEPIQSRAGWARIGNRSDVALTDNMPELKWFRKLANNYSLGKVGLFKELHDRRREAMDKIKEFFDTLTRIKKELDSGLRLKGECNLCRDICET